MFKTQENRFRNAVHTDTIFHDLKFTRPGEHQVNKSSEPMKPATPSFA
jgi:hypothetical protein